MSFGSPPADKTKKPAAAKEKRTATANNGCAGELPGILSSSAMTPNPGPARPI